MRVLSAGSAIRRKIEVSEAERCVNIARPLTHPLDLGEEGLAVNATPVCSVFDCGRAAKARGLCGSHYYRLQKYGDAEAPHQRRPRTQDTCVAKGCDRTDHGGFGLCEMHYQRQVKGTVPMNAPRSPSSVSSTPEYRFWSHLDPDVRDRPGECWIWRGARDGGYGKFRPAGRVTWLAHRWAYEFLVGPIPDGLHIDHLCRITACVNPAHLEPVTNQENIRRRVEATTHCRNGHVRNEQTTYRNKSGLLVCRPCKNERKRNLARAS